MITEIASGIYTASQQVADGKNGIVFTKRGAIAIDVGIAREEGQMMADFIRAQGYEPSRVILTHGHSDHVLGGQAFRDAEVYGNKLTPHEIEDTLQSYAKHKGLELETLIAQALKPTVMFSDELFLDMGDKQFHLFPTPGHSADHISVYLIEDRILFAGDVVVTGIVPAIFFDSEVLERSLELLDRMQIEILVAGHGPVLYGQASIHDWLRWEIRYLRRLRDYVTQALNSDDPLETSIIAAEADFATYIEDRLSPDSFGMVRRHFNTVAKICDEQRAKLI